MIEQWIVRLRPAQLRRPPACLLLHGDLQLGVSSRGSLLLLAEDLLLHAGLNPDDAATLYTSRAHRSAPAAVRATPSCACAPQAHYRHAALTPAPESAPARTRGTWAPSWRQPASRGSSWPCGARACRQQAVSVGVEDHERFNESCWPRHGTIRARCHNFWADCHAKLHMRR